jgi:branched-chain amino acid transport system permease protein
MEMGVSELLQFLVAGLKNGSIYALMALGFTIVFASTGVINFAQGEFYMLGGMFTVLVLDSLGVPLLAAAILGVVLTTLVGIVFELLAIRPRKDGDPLALIIITVGGSILLQSLARHGMGSDELPLPFFTEGPSVIVAGAAIERQTLWIWGITLIAVVALTILYRRTMFGKAMRACAIDRTGARLVGISAQRMVTASFALAAMLGALAGVAVAPLTQTAFNAGASVGVKGFAAAILGGLGNPIAAVVGGLLLGVIESFTVAFLSSTFKDAVALIVLLAVLFIRPQGLLGKRSKEKV